VGCGALGSVDAQRARQDRVGDHCVHDKYSSPYVVGDHENNVCLHGIGDHYACKKYFHLRGVGLLATVVLIAYLCLHGDGLCWCRHLVGTLEYLAPECLLKEPASPQSDVYSFAVLFSELLTGTFPFSDCTRDNPAAHTVLEMGYGRCVRHFSECLLPRQSACGILGAVPLSPLWAWSSDFAGIWNRRGMLTLLMLRHDTMLALPTKT
jgi:Protein kinase domain